MQPETQAVVPKVGDRAVGGEADDDDPATGLQEIRHAPQALFDIHVMQCGDGRDEVERFSRKRMFEKIAANVLDI